MSERGRDPYALLGVAPDADAGEVARAYGAEVHPDTGQRRPPRLNRCGCDGQSRAGGGLRARTRTGTAMPVADASAGFCAARRCAS
jgi:hypothetical protein